jgi:hypothetical protein
MQDRAEKRRINRELQAQGLPSLEARDGLMEALGRRVKDHGHFRLMLTKCEPRERGHMYEALRPHLPFEAKPLDVYIGEAALVADQKQLPRVNPDGTFSAYRPFEIRTLWSTVLKLESVNPERLAQTMRNLIRDIPDDKQGEAIFKVNIVKKVPEDIDYLRISAGLYVNGEPQRVQ